MLSSLPEEKLLLNTLIDHLEILSTYQQPDLERLNHLIQQLKPGLGNGNYLRALPLTNVDTKFIETNFTLVEALTSEGFQILSDVRSKLSDVTPLMMDAPTFTKFENQMVSEPDSVAHEPPALSDEECILFRALRSGKYDNARLEQERIPLNYAQQAINVWMEVGRIP